MSDTTQIILTVIATGVTLLGILAGLLVSLFRIQREDSAEIRQEIRALHSRIDALYQALFNRKDPAA